MLWCFNVGECCVTPGVQETLCGVESWSKQPSYSVSGFVFSKLVCIQIINEFQFALNIDFNTNALFLNLQTSTVLAGNVIEKVSLGTVFLTGHCHLNVNEVCFQTFWLWLQSTSTSRCKKAYSACIYTLFTTWHRHKSTALLNYCIQISPAMWFAGCKWCLMNITCMHIFKTAYT